MADETGAVGLSKLAFGAVPKITEEERAVQAGIEATIREVLVQQGVQPGGPRTLADGDRAVGRADEASNGIAGRPRARDGVG
jgi:hypothetical protein